MPIHSLLNSPRLILLIIVLAQFCCTSPWFASNAVIGDLIHQFGLEDDALGIIASAVQLGFIAGTLVFALLNIADRFSPSKVFTVCALINSGLNTAVIWEENGLYTLLLLRFSTGFCLAGVYPVGMKIAADHFDKGLGKSLGYLVGALVLGTAFPHLIGSLDREIPWQYVLLGTSALSAFGGLLMALVPNGPFHQPAQKLELSAFFKVFRGSKFRSAAFGYFGHMWELYAFWVFVPILVTSYNHQHGQLPLTSSLLSFMVIGIGCISCIIGGYLAHKFGSKKVAHFSLLFSGACCIAVPFVVLHLSPVVFLFFLLFWGMVVISDSPQFSTLVAQSADSSLKGTALTIVNCIGFAITIVSIQLLGKLIAQFDSPWTFMILAIGPLVGLTVQSSK